MGSAGFIMEAAKFITEHQSDDLLNIGEGDRFRKEIFHGSVRTLPCSASVA